jgi:hypothetical protein
MANAMKNGGYFQFPISMLHLGKPVSKVTAAEKSEALQQILGYCLADVYERLRTKYGPVELADWAADEANGQQDAKFDPENDADLYAASQPTPIRGDLTIQRVSRLPSHFREAFFGQTLSCLAVGFLSPMSMGFDLEKCGAISSAPPPLDKNDPDSGLDPRRPKA